MVAERQARDVAREPADADWIPRLLREMNLQVFEAGTEGGLFQVGLQSFGTLMRLLTHPGELAAAQQAMLTLGFTHFWALQSDWADASWRFLAGESAMSPAADRLPHLGVAPWLPPLFVRPLQIA